MKPVRMLGAAILALTGLVAVGLTTEAATASSSRDLAVQYSKVMKYESIYVGGLMSPQVARTVKLQYRDHDYGAWTTKATSTSNSSGSFVFPLSTSKTRYWRYYAPASGSHAKILGYSKKISVVSQTAKYFVVTPNVSCSNTPHNVTLVAQFYPARNGREVIFSTNVGVVNAHMDSNGVAVATFNPGSAAFSHIATATAQPYNGAAAKASGPFTYSQAFCD